MEPEENLSAKRGSKGSRRSCCDTTVESADQAVQDKQIANSVGFSNLLRLSGVEDCFVNDSIKQGSAENACTNANQRKTSDTNHNPKA
jgi:hypothetical protein